ncbi:MAG TPA: alpha/beta hydrolase, partial [Desulfosarcina sp.]|nr:alpha/beta hydrolase [Desulfosarcina sp.]
GSHQVRSLRPIAACHVTDHHARHGTIADMAAAIVADAPARFALAGLSMGGYVALEICRQFGSRVDRLALVDTSARPDTPEQTQRRGHLTALCRKGRFQEMAESLYPFLVHPGRSDDAVLKRRIVDMAHRVGSAVFLRQQRAIVRRIDQRPNLAAIDCPTVVICGEQDQITPMACSKEMAAGIRGAGLEVLADCGHMSTMERPDMVAAILRGWLTRAR